MALLFPCIEINRFQLYSFYFIVKHTKILQLYNVLDSFFFSSLKPQDAEKLKDNTTKEVVGGWKSL